MNQPIAERLAGGPTPDWVSSCGSVVLFQGDCRRVLRELPEGVVEAVVTDPPYGIDHKSNGQIFLEAAPIAGDADTQLIEWLDEWALCRCALVSFFSPYAAPTVRWRSVLVWDKGAHVGGGGDMATCWKRDCELVGVKNNKPLLGKRDSCVLRFSALLAKPSGHFCEKPLPLMGYLLRKLSEHVILDPCLGSGATGVSCVRLGKPFIGCELEPRWFDYSVKRISAELNRFPLLAPLESKPVQGSLLDAISDNTLSP